ncbi:vitamin K-dependent protein C-like isoform X1 [Euwallacea fornicatus]|uniref:vitamin K-dependent protein C-like isoform X1 n=1 Tax=Euwallacea fornicatus TaxID=995702 RepID=UPI0033906047
MICSKGNNLPSFIAWFIISVNMVLCIRFDTRRGIVNGFTKPTEPNEGDFPHHASLVTQVNSTRLIFCGGSLIHPKWVLTAAHCLERDGKQFPSRLIKVSVGSVYSDLRDGQSLEVSDVYIHEGYFSGGGDNDIGLLTLTTPAVISRFIQTVALHTNNSENLIGQTVYLTGLGVINDFLQRPSRLRRATLHVNSAKKCLLKATHSQLCCTSTIHEGKACKGDSGGPLVMKSKGKFFQIGITSRLAVLPLCKLTFNHSVYTKVAAYIAWISGVTAISFSNT